MPVAICRSYAPNKAVRKLVWTDRQNIIPSAYRCGITSSKSKIVVKGTIRVNSLPDDKILDWSKLSQSAAEIF